MYWNRIYTIWNILQEEPKDFSRIIYGENVLIGAGNKLVGIQTGQDDKTISQGSHSLILMFI